MRQPYILLLLFLLIATPAFSSGDDQSNSVAQLFAKMSQEYATSLSEHNYQQAYLLATRQLELDPSDTVAYLRMAIAAQHLEVDRQKLFDEHAPFISERDAVHVEIKTIANALLLSSRSKQ